MDDLISRQAVLEATSTTLKITGKENAETVYKYIKKLCDDIKALPSEPQWIPCSERLPEKDGRYLCDYGDCIDFGAIEKGKWYIDLGAVAWMPLPEPYKGE